MVFIRTDSYTSNSPHEKRREQEAAKAAPKLPDLGDAGMPAEVAPEPAAVPTPVPEAEVEAQSEMDYALEYVKSREAQLDSELSGEDTDEAAEEISEPEEDPEIPVNPDTADALAHGIEYYLGSKATFEDEYINQPVSDVVEENEMQAESKNMPEQGSKKKVFLATDLKMHIIPEGGGDPIEIKMQKSIVPETFWNDPNQIIADLQGFFDSERFIARCPGRIYDLLNTIIWKIEEKTHYYKWARSLEMYYLGRKQDRERLERRWAYDR